MLKMLSTRHHRSRGLGCALIALVAAGLSAEVRAQDWVFQPTIEAGVDYNDNVRLNEAQQNFDDEVLGVDVSAGARISRRSPTGSVEILPRIRVTRYDSDIDADAEDFFLDGVFRRNGQTNRFALTARFIDEDVIRSELDDPDFDNPDVDRPITDDSGLVRIKNRMRLAGLFPDLEFDLSERTRLGFGAGFMDVDYDNDQGSLSGFQNIDGSVRLTRQLSDRDAIEARLFARTYEPDLGGFEADSVGLRLRLNRQVSEKLVGYVMAGYEDFDTSSGSSESAFLFGAGMTRQFVVSRLVFDISSSADPSGVGQVLERNQVRAKLERDLSDLTNVWFSLRFQETEGLLFDAPNSDREFLRAELGTERRLNRAWTVVARYAHTRQEFAVDNRDETSNALFVGVRFQPPAQR